MTTDSDTLRDIARRVYAILREPTWLLFSYEDADALLALAEKLEKIEKAST